MRSGAVSATGQAVAPVQPVLVGTKLHVPQLRPGLVPRPDLVARLTAREGQRLSLICAPAGWGKTVLLSEWHAAPEETRAFAWVSLDRADDDPVRFWRYVIAALATVEPAVGDAALAALPTAGARLVDAVVAPLINDLDSSSEQLVLVLDDYHLVHAEAIHESVAFLLRHLPQNVHLAIASRADPPLPLASLRAAGGIAEVRAAELRFSDAEAEALFNDSLGLDLDSRQVELLLARTEGWAAGLRLAGLSVQAQEDRRAFIEEFAGDDRQIGDYLHEVLDDQPAPLRSFLLQTSILERMCAPLCDVVTGAGDAAARLEEVERSNLFLVSLDSHREWYRYHHLFRDLLRNELARDDPELVSALHRRASAWHEEHGNIEEAIAHAASAEAFAKAGELIARHWFELFTLGQIETVAGWIDALPQDTVRADVRLCVARAWSALFLGRLDEASSWRQEWELEAGAEEDAAPGQFAAVAFDAAYAFRLGDVGRANEAGRLVLALYPDPTDVRRAYASINLGESLYYAGELPAAAACLEEAVGHLAGRAPSPVVTEGLLHGLGYLAAVRADLGERDQAERAAAEGERLIAEVERYEIPWGALIYVARGKLLELHGDPAGAEAAFSRAEALTRSRGWPLERAQTLLLLARLKHRAGRQAEARALARDAREVLRPCPDPGVLRELLARTERLLQLAPGRRAAGPVLPGDLDLSERELGVLRLLASELSQREIGSQLYISLNTVKGHVRSIFRKLGVATRAEAVARARELGLL